MDPHRSEAHRRGAEPSGDAVPTGMGGRGISLVRGSGSTPTTGRGWMSTGATGLDWTTGGD